MNANQIEHKELELKKMRTCIRMQGKALSTERGYPRSVGKYIEFICSRKWSPEATSRDKVEVFLGKEANRGVSSSTQNGAFSAILDERLLNRNLSHN